LLPNFYNLNDVNVSIIHATPIPPLFEKVMLQLGNPLQRNKVYVLTSQSLKDCAGNEIEKNNSIGLGWASPPGENDIIINEAFLTVEENVSVEKEIDTAMKLGTNYPYGPFEWGEKIGLNKVVYLLEVLEKEQNRYKPAGLLKNKILV